MSRFYVPKESVKGKRINISGKEAHHIRDVMRLKESDEVVTFDGTGKEYVGIIREARPRSLLIEVTGIRTSLKNENTKTTLMQAIPKKEKMDYIVEKATELGVASIIPVITARTIIKWDNDKKDASVERWRKIVLEASKQCGRTNIPEVSRVRSFGDLMNTKSDYGLSLIAALSDDAVPIKEVLAGSGGGAIAVLIGPEGDFTPGEVEKARACGFKAVNLGMRVLKSDTAGLAVLSILNYEFS